MDTFLCLIGFLTLSVISGSSASASHDQLRITASDIFGAAYADGYRQIVAANLSSKCKETALKELAAAHQADSPMTCSGFSDNMRDIWDIVNTAIDSVGQLVTDLNTVINSVPLCFHSLHLPWINVPGWLSCTAGQATTLWTTFKDFWNYKDYVMDTVNVIEDYVNCLKQNKKTVSQNVQVIVETAKLCR